MADVSTVTMPDGSVKDIKDSISRSGVYELVDSGAKNIVTSTATTDTVNGITYTVNSDGSITANGTATDLSTFRVATAFTSPANMVLSGCPAGGSNTTYELRLSQNARDYGAGAFIEDTITDNIAIVVRKDVALSNIVFRPMICTKAVWDISQAYQPYRPSYQELISKSEVFGRGTPIASGADLNDYTTIGRYYSESSTVSSSLTNPPTTTSGFTLKVEEGNYQTSTKTSLIQFAIVVGTNKISVYMRGYRSSGGTWGWTPWNSFTGELPV